MTKLYFRPEVQRIFMAYIADLTNVLDTLYTLTTRRKDTNLNIRTVKTAFMAYCRSVRRRDVHTRIRQYSITTLGSNGVISEIQSLVRERYAIDKDLMKAIWKIPPSDLEGEEAWYV